MKIIRNDFSNFNPQPKPEKVVKPKKGLSKKPVNDFAQLKNEADRVWSEYIRRYYTDNKGIVKCFTCDNKSHWKQMHNGHYINRNQYVIRYDFRNCHPQCEECNVVKSGNIEVYTRRIDMYHGRGTAEALKAEARKPFKLTREHLNHIIDNYKTINR